MCEVDLGPVTMAEGKGRHCRQQRGAAFPKSVSCVLNLKLKKSFPLVVIVLSCFIEFVSLCSPS